MVNNTNLLSGTAMSVLSGVVLVLHYVDKNKGISSLFTRTKAKIRLNKTKYKTK
ncbi:MAG: hypothetical protein KC550_03170 [Nanoarchaeota archaeon]|nr:hypothetical protein [Nanoarchaeota archaeon]